MFLDESGVTTEMTRRYGWAPRPERVSEAVPAGHWRTLTVLAALTTAGVLASMTIESATDGDIFLAFMEQVLAPRLEPVAKSLGSLATIQSRGHDTLTFRWCMACWCSWTLVDQPSRSPT